MKNYQTLFIDLDDTIYPHRNGLWEALRARINTYMNEVAGIARAEIPALRQYYLSEYGTTMAGLIRHYDIKAADYLEFVHSVPVGPYLQPDRALQLMLQTLPQQKYIFTSASSAHAERVLDQMEISQYFSGIIDIVAVDLHNKPQQFAYRRALEIAGNPDPKACVFVDDRVENLIPASEMGWTTVLVNTTKTQAHIDFSIEKLSDLLEHVPALLN